MKTSSWIAIAFLVVSGCSSEEEVEPDPDPDPDPDPASVTWHQDVAPIVAGHCQTCHSPGNIGPFPLVTYNDAKPMASWMATMVEDGVMPPWGAVETDDCAPRHAIADDPRLTDAEIEILRAWADADAPEGDPDNAAPLPEPPDRSLTDATHRVEVGQPWVTSGYADEFRCFVFDPELTSDMWLTGLEVLPGNVEVVHHATLQLDVARVSETLADADGGYECFGGVGFPATFLGGYTPSSPPFRTPDGSGLLVPAGSLLVMQVHYHPLGEPAEPDDLAVDLRLQDSFPGREAAYQFIGNQGSAPVLQPGPNDRDGVEFRVPAGVADHTETMRLTLSEDLGERIPIWSLYPHMHYVGVDIEIRVERANPGDEPAEECLIKASQYDFDWQRLYPYDASFDELPTVGAGDTLVIKCTYDNTMANENVARGVLEQGLDAPIDVYLGEQTLDEMCIGIFGAVLP